MDETPHELWHPPRTHPLLAHDAVHIWSVRLDPPPERVQWLAGLLDATERTRAAAFRFEHLRRRYTVAHGVVRLLLARYLAADPSEIEFRFGAIGKPSLVTLPNGRPLCFNVSHSDDLALLAVAQGCELGVDVERVRSIDDADSIARSYFCTTERDTLRQREGDAKSALFLRYWTRKEAIIKMTGDGLQLPLDCVDVSTIPGDQSQAIAVLDGSGVPRHLALIDLEPASNYTGALAVEGTGWRLSCWRWSA